MPKQIAEPRISRPRRCNKLIALTGLSLLVGCSSYESKWKEAATRPNSTTGIEGRWEGTWQSEANHHTGGLRCILTRRGDGDAYHADYHATYWKIFSFGYAMPLSVASRDGDTVSLKGDADLGWLAGGKYTYDGVVSPTEFRCKYESKSDHGTFTMRRPTE